MFHEQYYVISIRVPLIAYELRVMAKFFDQIILFLAPSELGTTGLEV